MRNTQTLHLLVFIVIFVTSQTSFGKGVKKVDKHINLMSGAPHIAKYQNSLGQTVDLNYGHATLTIHVNEKTITDVKTFEHEISSEIIDLTISSERSHNALNLKFKETLGASIVNELVGVGNLDSSFSILMKGNVSHAKFFLKERIERLRERVKIEFFRDGRITINRYFVTIGIHCHRHINGKGSTPLSLWYHYSVVDFF